MAHYASPDKRGSRSGRPLKHHDVTQTSRKDHIAWKSEIAGRIIPISNNVEDFLEHFVPGEKPKRSVARAVFNMPEDAKHERELYDPLSNGFTGLVSRFSDANRLEFVNHNHTAIRFPYALCESEHHITRPDVVALLPGEASFDSAADGWSKISFVIEAKLKDSEDPMKSYSKVHEETLIQLSKSARNILVSQSRLFVFTIGIYGRLARIFRFDHAGAVCSRAFDYTTLDGSRLLHNFLWRFTHPLNTNCTIVGADPTVSLIKTEGDRNAVTRRLRDKGLEHEFTAESAKAYRYIMAGGKRYLTYDLMFINPHLFSRATTVWEAIAVDEDDEPAGDPVVIKDSWRQLVRQLESENYIDIFSSASDTNIPGVAKYLSGEDLGDDEIKALQDGEPGGKGVGHLTVTARHYVKGEHAHNERSHGRLVLGTVGVPLSRFRNTKEMAQALRDAIEGHRRAFKAGVMHRDISEGNVMILRGLESCLGYIQDFDYGLNWKKLLPKLDFQSEEEDWDSFVSDECTKIRQKVQAKMNAIYATTKATKKPARGENEGGKGNQEVADEDNDPGSAGAKTARDIKQSLGTENADADADDVEDAPGGVKIMLTTRQERMAAEEPLSPEEVKRRWKQRTGTLYFMAVEIIGPDGDVVHEVRHDLESFFWLLVWLVMRHTDHENGVRACESLFDGDTDEACRDKKVGYLTREVGVTIDGHGALNFLLERFRALCSKNFWRRDSPPVPLTYASVLDVFDKALEMDWPDDDEACPYVFSDDNPQTDHRPRDRRVTSDLNSSRIGSVAQSSYEPGNIPCARPSGQSQSRQPSLRNRGATGAGGSNARVASGSRPRKRSRELRDTSEIDREPERSKRTRSDRRSASGKR